MNTLTSRLGCSQRFACRVTKQSRSTQRRTPRKQTSTDPHKWLRDWLNNFAHQQNNQRKGYRRAYADLRAEGHVINYKKVQRIWREEGLQVKARKRRKRVGTTTTPINEAADINQVWAVDFQFDSTSDGRAFKICSMVDEYTRESLVNIVDRSITSLKLTDAISKVVAKRGRPVTLRCDNGSEMIAETLRQYCQDFIGIHYTPPGEPWKNGYIESFNNRVRDECLNLNQFHSLLQARVIIEDWKHNYNNHHRHSRLEYQTPNEYANKIKQNQTL